MLIQLVFSLMMVFMVLQACSVRTEWDTTKYQGNLLSFAVFSQPKSSLQYVTITGTRIKIHLHFVWRIYLILVPVLVTYCKLPKLQVLHEYKDLDDKNPNLVHIFIQSKFSILSVRIEALFPGLWHCPTGRRHSYTASCLKGTKCKEDLNHCLLTRLAASQVSRWVNIYKHNCSC